MSIRTFTVAGDRIVAWVTGEDGVPVATACWEGWALEGGGLYFKRFLVSQTPTWP